MSELAAFLAALKEDALLRESLRHHEILSGRPPEWVERLPEPFDALAPALERALRAVRDEGRQALLNVACV